MTENQDQESKEQSNMSRWKFKNRETRWISKLTKKIKWIGKPVTRIVLLIPTDTNPVKKLMKLGFKIAPKTV